MCERRLIMRRLCELERTLDVFFRRLEVTLAAVAAGTRLEELRAEQVDGRFDRSQSSSAALKSASAVETLESL